jgi:hypothetical protein
MENYSKNMVLMLSEAYFIRLKTTKKGNNIGVDPESFLMRISLNKRTFISAKPISRKILKIRVNWPNSCNSH